MNIEENIKQRIGWLEKRMGLSNNERELITFQMKELAKQLTLTDVGYSLKTKETITFEDWAERKGFIRYAFDKYINADKDIWKKTDLEKMYNRLTKL